MTAYRKVTWAAEVIKVSVVTSCQPAELGLEPQSITCWWLFGMNAAEWDMETEMHFWGVSNNIRRQLFTASFLTGWILCAKFSSQHTYFRRNVLFSGIKDSLSALYILCCILCSLVHLWKPHFLHFIPHSCYKQVNFSWWYAFIILPLPASSRPIPFSSESYFQEDCRCVFIKRGIFMAEGVWK